MASEKRELGWCFVYRNLHRAEWSITAARGQGSGRVIAHAPEVTITNAILVVRPSGRRRVIAEQRKNVHAGVRGDVQLGLPDPEELRDLDAVPIRYNPYEHSSFVRRDDETVPVTRAAVVTLDAEGRATAYLPRS